MGICSVGMLETEWAERWVGLKGLRMVGLSGLLKVFEKVDEKVAKWVE
jgi:hypothetical protein